MDEEIVNQEGLEQKIDADVCEERMSVSELNEGLKQLIFGEQAFIRFNATERSIINSVINYLEIEPCQDCVSKNRVINAILGDESIPNNIANKLRQNIEALPSARLLRNGGKWIREKGDRSSKCPICSEFSTNQSKYCPNCGAELSPSSPRKWI